MANILVTGGAGYVGSMLVPSLLDDGHKVRVFDRGWFGNAKDWRAHYWNQDIRNIRRFEDACTGIDAIIHLACISNDASFKLDEKLSTEINFDAFEPLVLAAKRSEVKRFIFASSSSVYGMSKAKNVTENHPLVPLTLYNKYKAACEEILFRHQTEDFTTVAIRPATVCGPSPRMRFDLMVNSFINQAINKGEIMVMGGDQYRANLHINDMVRAYKLLLSAPKEKIGGESFNCGAENMTVSEIGDLVCATIEAEGFKRPIVSMKSSQDKRSYRINSDKIKDILGFIPKFKVEHAILDMCDHFRRGEWQDGLSNRIYMNLDQYIDARIA